MNPHEAMEALPGLIAGLEFNVERMREAAADPALGATDLAEELVRRGMPFRSAHEVIGGLVRTGKRIGDEVEITADRARFSFSDGKRKWLIKLKREDGDWRIDDIELQP